jgi:uncharacterized protein YlxP (DUF503 family)
MIVGAALLDIHVHGSRSLKQKRGVVRSIIQRVRNRFNLSVAEVGGQDTWQHATLALGAVGSDERTLRQALENALRFIENLHLAEVLGAEIEILDLPHEGSYVGSLEDEDPPDEGTTFGQGFEVET